MPPRQLAQQIARFASPPSVAAPESFAPSAAPALAEALSRLSGARGPVA